MAVPVYNLTYNLTNFNEGLFYTFNTTAGIVDFFTIILPTLILCLLCVMALLSTDEIKEKIKVLIINLFISEAINWILYCDIFLGFASRYRDQSDVSCRMAASLFLVAGPTKIAGTALYSVMVYAFVKHGTETVNWCAINTAVAVMWAVTVSIGTLGYTTNFFVNNAGFCEGEGRSVYFLATSILSAAALIVTVLFSLFTYCYMRRNYDMFDEDVLEEDDNDFDNGRAKQYTARHLYFMMVSASLTFTVNTVPAVYPNIRAALVDYPILRIVIINYFLKVSYSLLRLLTPIATIMVLKPVRPALRSVFTKLCARCNRNTYTFLTCEENPSIPKVSPVTEEEEDEF
jgi:hypothetical protein